MAKISQNQLAKLFQRLATSYTAGIDLRTAYRRETETGSPTYRQKSNSIYKGLGQGKELAEAMADTEGYFPDLAISVVKAGERGGRLDEAFKRLFQHYRNLVEFRNKFLNAIAWPAFELVFAIMIVGLLMVICDWLFSALGRQKFDWFWMGSTVGNVIAYFVLVIIGFASLTGIVIGTTRGWFGTIPMSIAMRIPLIGKTIECLALSRFAWTMSMAENAGMGAIANMKLSLRATENFFYKRLAPQICSQLRDGKEFGVAMRSTQAFPEDLLIYVENGETAGELAETMDRCSHEFQERAETNLKAMGTIGFVLMMLFVAGMVLLIVLFAMSQYVNIINDMANGKF
ncbi:MAG: type II secretion system F family protein [Planctomycetota bacterium]